MRMVVVANVHKSTNSGKEKVGEEKEGPYKGIYEP
jgi:hypothetical protein